MKCRYCGHEIPNGKLYCEKCGKEVRIVPDYNPLEDMLTEQIRGAISGDDDYDIYDYDAFRNTNSGKVRSVKGNTGRNTRTKSMASREIPEREKRRRQIERKKALKKKKRKRVLLVLLLFLVVIVGVCIGLYQISYSGVVNKGYKAIEKKEYEKASAYFNKAIRKNEEKPEAYTGLSKVYIAQDKEDEAEGVFLDVIKKQPKNTEIYRACVQFYIETEQKEEIPLLLEDAEGSVTKELSEYIIEEPEFSLDDSEVYDDVQQVALTAKKGYVIYYTTDESEPTTKSTKYTEPIHLDEGKTVVKAIAVNKKGIPSLTEKKTYTVELPMEDAPAVSPSTGQYEEATQIEIKVPEGYEAYYTMDRSDPTTASKKYTGPIAMPEGETIFKAILVNSKGRVSGITTRNYVLEIGNED